MEVRCGLSIDYTFYFIASLVKDFSGAFYFLYFLRLFDLHTLMNCFSTLQSILVLGHFQDYVPSIIYFSSDLIIIIVLFIKYAEQNIDNIFLFKKHQTKNIKGILGTHEALSLKAQDDNACRDKKFYAGLWLSLNINYPADTFCIILDVIGAEYPLQFQILLKIPANLFQFMGDQLIPIYLLL